MDIRPRPHRTSPMRLVDSMPSAVDSGPKDAPARPVSWPERLGWAAFGVVVLALWIGIGVWLWGVIAP